MTDLKEVQRFFQGPSLETLEFFGISHSSHQPSIFLIIY